MVPRQSTLTGDRAAAMPKDHEKDIAIRWSPAGWHRFATVPARSRAPRPVTRPTSLGPVPLFESVLARSPFGPSHRSGRLSLTRSSLTPAHHRFGPAQRRRTTDSTGYSSNHRAARAGGNLDAFFRSGPKTFCRRSSPVLTASVRSFS